MAGIDAVADKVKVALRDWEQKSRRPRTANLANGFVVSARSTYGNNWSIRAQMVHIDSHEQLNTSNGILTITSEQSAGLAIYAPGYVGHKLFIVGDTAGFDQGSATELRWSAWCAGGTTPFVPVTWVDGTSTFWFETPEIAQSQSSSVALQLANNGEALSLDIHSLSVLPTT